MQELPGAVTRHELRTRNASYQLGQRKEERTEGWAQARSAAFTEELVQWRVPLQGRGVDDAVVVGAAASPSGDAVHVLTSQPGNL